MQAPSRLFGRLVRAGWRPAAVILTSAVLASVIAQRMDAQMLETETARLLPRGWWKVGGAFETQTAPDGREHATPFLLEYGLTHRLELLVEPVPFTAIRPKTGRRATGAGDLEATLTYGLRGEQRGGPGIALAIEAKVPTARNRLIGTGKADFASYVIATQQFGRLVTHANASYTVTGSPAGVRLNNVWGGALAAVLKTGPRTQLFAEVLGATAAAPEGVEGDTQGTSARIPEAAGAEVVGTLGASMLVFPSALFYAGLSRDNTRATQLRLGVTLTYRTPRSAR